MRTRYFWNPERDRLLRELASTGEEIDVIVRQLLATGDGEVAAPNVRRRMKALGIAHARRGAWNADTDARFIALWMREPKLSLAAIRTALGVQVKEARLSQRARDLGLPRRKGGDASDGPKCVAIRSPFAGERFHAALEKPAPRPKLAPLSTPCPFIEPATGVRCDVMVDRRPDRHGVKPSQYCDCHRARVLPISRGSIGTLATYAKGRKYG